MTVWSANLSVRKSYGHVLVWGRVFDAEEEYIYNQSSFFDLGEVTSIFINEGALLLEIQAST